MKSSFDIMQYSNVRAGIKALQIYLLLKIFQQMGTVETRGNSPGVAQNDAIHTNAWTRTNTILQITHKTFFVCILFKFVSNAKELVRFRGS